PDYGDSNAGEHHEPFALRKCRAVAHRRGDA
ncbi:hypothetical protein L917_01042, partial [Phytophthora nicotianae]